jgi:hypothetical protein
VSDTFLPLPSTALVLTAPETGDAEITPGETVRDTSAAVMTILTTEYVGEQREGNSAEVRTLFRGYKNDTGVDVRLVNQSGQWLIYDAVIDRVPLVDNYRSQFVHVIREAASAGLDGRLEAMILLSKTFERTVAR